MKSNFWHKFFRKGYNTHDECYNGKEAKREAKSTRTKMKRLMKKYHSPESEVTDVTLEVRVSNAPAIIFKPNGQLAGTGDKNVVVRFVEINRYGDKGQNAGQAPKLPLNINWLTCKTKFLDPVQ